MILNVMEFTTVVNCISIGIFIVLSCKMYYASNEMKDIKKLYNDRIDRLTILHGTELERIERKYQKMMGREKQDPK